MFHIGGIVIMPEVFPNNKYWLRGGHLNQKRHLEMTEEEKLHVAKCTGKKGGIDHPCKNPMFRCTKCGTYGCAQEDVNICSDQGFKNDKCLNCGNMGTRVPIMEDELVKFIAIWQEEVPEIRK